MTITAFFASTATPPSPRTPRTPIPRGADDVEGSGPAPGRSVALPLASCALLRSLESRCSVRLKPRLLCHHAGEGLPPTACPLPRHLGGLPARFVGHCGGIGP